jgi:putative ABC transport system ATP-binding protein
MKTAGALASILGTIALRPWSDRPPGSSTSATTENTAIGRRFPAPVSIASSGVIHDTETRAEMNAAATGQTAPAQPLSEPPVRVAARDLSRRYGDGDMAVDALRGVSLAVAEGALVAVMGPSGSGKSTLMHLLAGLDRPTSGEAWIDGTQIGALGDTELTTLRRRHIGFVFQFFNLLPMLTAEENVLLPLRLAGRTPEQAWVEELLGRVGLGDRRAHRPSELSGGQQQRVALARALVTKPTVVFADEPTGNLDSTTSREILALLRDSVSGYGQTMVMVTHDPTAAAIADRIVFLADGRVVRELGRSSAHEVLAAMEEVSAR